jgi:hypothetical protein
MADDKPSDKPDLRQIDTPPDANQELPGEAQSFSQPIYKNRSWKRFIKPALTTFAIALGVFIVLLAAGYGLWRYVINKPVTPEQDRQPSAEQQSEGNAVASELSETYSSDQLRLEFNHPADWEVTEADGGIKIVSPEFEYTKNDQSNVNGHFKIYIRKGSRDIDGQYIGRGTTIEPSQAIAYTDPAPGQREDTFISYFGLDEPDNFAFYIVQGNFKLKKGDTLGPDYAKEPDAYLIVGGYGASDLADDLATNMLSTEAFAGTSEFKTAVEIAKSLKLR